MKQLQGKRVLVTGGAHGIGLEMAIRFAERGCDVVLTDIDESSLGEAAELIRVLDRSVWTYPLDVTDSGAIAAVRRRVLADAGPPDVLINNAGVVFGGPFADVPLERHRLTFEVNTLGVVAMTHAFLPDLIGRDEAHLVNIASASGFIGLPHGSTYAASKWAVIGFSESIRQELELVGHEHVKVTIVCPSYIGTGMFDGVRPPATTRMLTPEFLSRQVVEAVIHERLYVLEPWLVKITPPLKGLLPTRVFDRISAALGANTSMSGWSGHGQGGEKG